jgi:hypothetical protein
MGSGGFCREDAAVGHLETMSAVRVVVSSLRDLRKDASAGFIPWSIAAIDAQ